MWRFCFRPFIFIHIVLYCYRINIICYCYLNRFSFYLYCTCIVIICYCLCLCIICLCSAGAAHLLLGAAALRLLHKLHQKIIFLICGSPRVARTIITTIITNNGRRQGGVRKEEIQQRGTITLMRTVKKSHNIKWREKRLGWARWVRNIVV